MLRPEARGSLSQELRLSMGGDYPRSLGARRSSERICPEIFGSSSKAHKELEGLGVCDSVNPSRTGFGTDQSHKGAPSEGGNSQGQGSILFGLLQQHLYGTQEEREIETCYQSQGTQQVSHNSQFQDGNNSLCLRGSSAPRLGRLSRPDRCLSACADSSVVPEVSTVRGERSSLPVPMPSIRTFHSSSGFHQAAGTIGGSSSCLGHSLSSVSGRSLDKISGPGTVHSMGPIPVRPALQVGPRCEPSKVRSGPQHDLCLHRGDVSHSSRSNATPRRPDSQNSESVSGLDQGQDSSSPNMAVSDRSFGISRETGSLRQAAHSASAFLCPQTVCSGSARTVPSSHSGSGGFRGPQLVVAHRQSDCRSAVGSVSPGSDPVHRRKSDTLGCSCSRLSRVRCLDLEGENILHQQPGTSGGDQSTGGSTRILEGQEGACSHRQHHCSGLHQPPRRNQVNAPVGLHVRSVPGGSPAGSRDQSSSYSGQNEQTCRSPVETRPNCQHRMDSLPGSRPELLGSLGQVSSGPNGHLPQQSVAVLHQSGSRSPSFCGRRNVLTLDRDGRVRFSAVGHDSGSSSQAPVGVVSHDRCSTSLAEQVLVSSSASVSHRLSQKVTSQKGSHNHANQRTVSRVDLFPGSSRMSTVFDETLSQGFSREVSKRAASSSVRDSSNRIYDSRWERYSLWCYQRDYDPLNASLAQVADFFLHLFDVEKRAPVTIEGYRTAINTVWNPMGKTLNGSITIDRLFRSFKLERPRAVHTFPRWDLNLVLRFLKRPEYHSDKINDYPLFFSSKVAFLLLLASARRCGDIHAIDPKRITFTSSAVILTPYPGYLPKALAVAEGMPRYEPIVIRNLSAITSDPDELLLCPVLAFKAYHSWADSRAPNRSGFFVSTRLNASPVVKATLSSWVRKLIRRAYENASPEDATLMSTSVHELRALATSLAVQATFALDDIVRAATWSTPAIFTSFYLRDVSGLQGRLHVIGPCIAAGKVLR